MKKLAVGLSRPDAEAIRWLDYIGPPPPAHINADGGSTPTYTWDTPARATPIAEMQALVAATRSLTVVFESLTYVLPHVYRAVREADRRAWWRSLPKRDKHWLRRQGVRR